MAKTYGERWQIERTLAEGGQAYTYLVVDLKGNKQDRYVLKRLKNLKRVDRFKREVDAIRKLGHQHIVQLMDHDLDVSEPYLVMEYCGGGSLDRAHPYWQGDASATLILFEQIATAVAYAHSNGVVHRDLKPANLLLRSPTGPVVVGDFGLALLADEEDRITGTSEAVGPRLYMAPELEDGRYEDVSTAADIYSLGKVLYWLFTGRIFSREKYRETTWNLLNRNTDQVPATSDVYLEHVNWLMDFMIVQDPAHRRTADNIAILAKHARALIETRKYPLVHDLEHPCAYCGLGYYKEVVDGNVIATRNFGYTAVGSAHWRIRVCSRCGHVQTFRLDQVKQSGWR